MDKYLDSLMNTLTKERGDNSITIYFPLIQGKVNSKVNSDKLMLLLKRVIRYLETARITNRKIKEILKPAYELIEKGIVSETHCKSMLICLRPNFYKFAQLPFSVLEDITIDSKFNLKPINEFYDNDSNFYLLAISRNQVSFYQCDAYNIRKLSIDDLPKNMEEVTGSKTIEKQLQRHAGAGAAANIMHGQMDSTDFKKDMLHKFIREIEKVISQYLKNHHEPLILASVSEIHDEYKKINFYKYLLDDYVSGSPDRMSENDLQQKAWKKLKVIRKEICV